MRLVSWPSCPLAFRRADPACSSAHHSGCSTFLKTLACETHGFFVSEESKLNYKGITPQQMRKNFAGEAV